MKNNNGDVTLPENGAFRFGLSAVVLGRPEILPDNGVNNSGTEYKLATLPYNRERLGDGWASLLALRYLW